ncbi:unnamed protein product [Camellia sinensis]
MENQGKERGGGRVVMLVPCPLQGHISLMIELAIALHSKGFSITIAHTFFNSPNPSNLTFHPIPGGLTNCDTSSGDFPTFVSTINTNCEAPIKECMAQMMNQEERMWNEVACIIYDTLMHATETVTNHLKISTIALRTTGASAMVVYGCMTRLYKDLVPGLHPLRFKDLPISKFDSVESLLQLLSIVCNKTSSGIIWNTLDSLENPTLSELQHYHQIPFFLIGPLFKISSPSLSISLLEENINCISWLDKQAPNSVLYISLGSLASVNETELVEMAWGLANSGQTFLWVIRLGSVHGSEWMELLPEGFDDVIGERVHCDVGTLKGGVGSQRSRGVLEPLWVEFGLGKCFSGGSNDMFAGFRRPESECEVC